MTKFVKQNTRRCSYLYKCTACGRIFYFINGNNVRKNKVDNPPCDYNFCPWCGERNEQ